MAIKQNRAIDPNDFLSKAGEGRTIRTYRKGQIVFSQGDQAAAVFYIQQGMTKASVVSEHGKEAIVAILGAGEFFGEKCLGGHPQRLTTVTAIMESTIARVEKTAMVRMLNNEAAFSEMFIACLVDQVTRKFPAGNNREISVTNRERFGRYREFSQQICQRYCQVAGCDCRYVGSHCCISGSRCHLVGYADQLAGHRCGFA